MSSLGIYFGPRAIGIVGTIGKKLVVSTQLLQPTTSTGELGEKVPAELKTIEIVALFKDELRRNNIGAKEATLCLSGKDLIIRNFEIPVLPAKELDSAISFEVKKYIPFKVEELISGFQVEYDKASRTNLVLFVGIKKETLDRYLSIASQLNLKISAIEYSAFSILRALKLAGVSDKGVIGILCSDLQGEDEVNFTVFENGFPLFSRDITLTFGPEELTKAEGSGQAEILEKLKLEMRISLDYYQRKFPTKNIQKLFFFSGQESRSDLEAYILEAGLSGMFIDAAKIMGKPGAYSSNSLKAYSASLIKTIKTRINVNLAAIASAKVKPHKAGAIERELSVFEGLRIDFRIIALGIVLCLGVFGYRYFYQIQPLKEEIAKVIGMRPLVTKVNPEMGYEELTNKDAEFKKKLDNLDTLIKKQLYLTTPLNIVPQVMPEGAWLTRFSFNKQEEGKADLVLEGLVYLGDNSREFEAVDRIVSGLKGNPDFSGYFKAISLDSINRQELEKVTVTKFLISCKTYKEKE
jgi:Tfp pilus assembly PilM family ATPase